VIVGRLHCPPGWITFARGQGIYGSFKKSFVALERDTLHNLERRRVFCALMRAVREKRLFFIDESFCKTGMCREFDWGLRGERVRGMRPFRSWKTVALIGAIRLGAKPKLMTYPGSVNGTVFVRFVRTRLVPWLRPGDVVVKDNLNIHKMLVVRSTIEAAGGTRTDVPSTSRLLTPSRWASSGLPSRTTSPLCHISEGRRTSCGKRSRTRSPVSAGSPAASTT
jgi:hypothetical protein